MFGQVRRVNDFDSFISNNQQPARMLSPRNQPFNNINNYQTNPYQRNTDKTIQRNLQMSKLNRSPNRTNNNRKPMISPVRSPRALIPNQPVSQRGRLKPRQDLERSGDNFCSNQNHPNRKAEYVIRIEEEDMYYCGICATQAASQGFTVSKIGSIPMKKSKNLPHYPNYNSSKRYQELIELMSNIMQLEGQFKQMSSSAVTQHYSQEEQILNNFYDQLIGAVERQREQHLNEIKCESLKNKQQVDIIHDNLKMHLEDLNLAWEDIQNSLVQIVEEVDAQSYQQCMNQYRNSIQVFSHKIQQYEDNAQQFSHFEPAQLQNKLKQFQNYLREIWEEHKKVQIYDQLTVKRIGDAKLERPSERSENKRILQFAPSSTTVKNVHEMLQKPINHQNCEGQTAFRNLFPQDEDYDRLPQASPQFKAF